MKIILTLIMGLFCVSAQAADFVISVQSSGGVKLWKLVNNYTPVATMSLNKVGNGVYYDAQGRRMLVNAQPDGTAKFLRLNNQYSAYYENSDCTGAVRITANPQDVALIANNSASLDTGILVISNILVSDNFQYQSAWFGSCSAQAGTLPTSFPISNCSNCSFNSNTAFTYLQE